jgi:hypothetical protein
MEETPLIRQGCANGSTAQKSRVVGGRSSPSSDRLARLTLAQEPGEGDDSP